MAKFNGKFESTRQDWNTPRLLFDTLNREFNFDWDLAASKENALCQNYFTEVDDALCQNWRGSSWLNPPYGNKKYKIKDWVKKAYNESQKDNTLIVVMLIPARTNTKWFHQYCMRAKEIRFICGRPKFGDAKHGLPQPLAIVVFQKSEQTKFLSFNLRDN